ncbi:hypothetical protein HDU93_007292 [Gonapodya sp. JEL0774]|nr:hypothetical protein HDU93_007292 [Gonapodya sp. JEL0774]
MAPTDLSLYVRFLLSGTGAEHQVDYAALRRELDNDASSRGGGSVAGSIIGEDTPTPTPSQTFTPKFEGGERWGVDASPTPAPVPNRTRTTTTTTVTAGTTGTTITPQVTSMAATTTPGSARSEKSDRLGGPMTEEEVERALDSWRERERRRRQEAEQWEIDASEGGRNTERGRERGRERRREKETVTRHSRVSTASVHAAASLVPGTGPSTRLSLSRSRSRSRTLSRSRSRSRYSDGEREETVTGKPRSTSAHMSVSTPHTKAVDFPNSTSRSRSRHSEALSDDRTPRAMSKTPPPLPSATAAVHVPLPATLDTSTASSTLLARVAAADARAVAAERAAASLRLDLAEARERLRRRDRDAEQAWREVGEPAARRARVRGGDGDKDKGGMKVEAAERVAREVAKGYEGRVAILAERVRLLEEEVAAGKRKLAEAERRAYMGAAEAARSEVHELRRRAEEAEDRGRRAEAKVARLQGEVEAEREEKEVLQLRMLEKKVGKVEESVPPPPNLTTRDLIRRDKLAAQASNLPPSLTSLSADAARALLGQVTNLLGVPDVDSLIPGVRDVAKVIKALPDVQRFVREVDEVVWGQFEDENGEKNVHKLVETAKRLREWREDVKRAKKLETFRRRVYRHLGMEPREAESAVLDQIAHSLHDAPKPGDTASDRLVARFQSLFDVASIDGVQSAMDRLYTQTSVADNALRRLKRAIGKDTGSITAVVDEACRIVDMWKDMEEELESAGSVEELRHGRGTGYQAERRARRVDRGEDENRFDGKHAEEDPGMSEREGDEAFRELGKLLGRGNRT